ncbi:MAG: PqqD family protein [Bdellovibrionales bacterium]|nr:PqqD family protein [Bdellovibrionales bacterium]
MSVSLAKVYKKNPNTPWQTLAGETIIIDPTQQYSHEMDNTATFIWNRLDGDHTLEQIVDALCAEYSVARELAQEDVVEFIELLSQKGLAVCQN